MRTIENNGHRIRQHELLIQNDQLNLKLMIAQCEKKELEIARKNDEKNSLVEQAKKNIENLKKKFGIEGSFGYDPITGDIL